MGIFDTTSIFDQQTPSVPRIELPPTPTFDPNLKISQGKKGFFSGLDEAVNNILEPVRSIFEGTPIGRAANQTKQEANAQSLINTSFALALKQKTQKLDMEETDLLKKGQQALAKQSQDLVLGFLNPESEMFKPLVNEKIAQTATDKLIQAIEEAKPVRAQAEKLYTTERTARAGAGGAAMEATKGEAGFGAALGKLKGELPKPKFEGVKNLFTQPEVDALFTKIQQHPAFDFYSKITTQNGLTKLLGVEGGAIPTENELKLLGDVFGRDLVDAVLKKRSLGEKIKTNLVDALNIPRALVSSFDMSAPLRQGLVLSVSHPVTATQAGVDMIKAFFNPKAYDALMENIAKRPTFKLMQDSGLALTDITGKAVSLSQKEESFMNSFAQKIPIIGQGVKASERAYTGFLNKIRADVFDNITARFIERGITPAENPDVYKFLAEFVNTASGRGSLGQTLNRSAPLMNSVFFSPRLMASRVNMLNPQWYFKLPPPVRAEAAKSFMSLVGTGLAVLGLAKLGGAEVSADPRNSDFGKIKVGDTRWDVWGGFQQWVRLAAVIITNQSVSSNTGKVTDLGKDYGSDTRLDKVVNFFLSKFAPVPSLATDILRGSNMIGQPVQVEDKFIPFYIKDMIEAYHSLGNFALPSVGIPGFFGVGTQTYEKPVPKKPKRIFD